MEDSAEEVEAAARNEYLRSKYGRLKSYILWRPSDIDMGVAREWWEAVGVEVASRPAKKSTHNN